MALNLMLRVPSQLMQLPFDAAGLTSKPLFRRYFAAISPLFRRYFAAISPLLIVCIESTCARQVLIYASTSIVPILL